MPNRSSLELPLPPCKLEGPEHSDSSQSDSETSGTTQLSVALPFFLLPLRVGLARRVCTAWSSATGNWPPTSAPKAAALLDVAEDSAASRDSGLQAAGTSAVKGVSSAPAADHCGGEGHHHMGHQNKFSGPCCHAPAMAA